METMEKDRQAQRFQLTINNPVEHGLTHEVIKNTLINQAVCGRIEKTKLTIKLEVE